VTENVSCLHDYTLKVSQMRLLEGADAVVISGVGLEDFLDDALLSSGHLIDASQGIHQHHAAHHGHEHSGDPHIWLSPENGKQMAANICDGLTKLYPEKAKIFSANLEQLLARLDALQQYGQKQLSTLSCRKLITFHDGFSYFAESFDLTILKAIEEESGSEASAAELKELITLVQQHQLPAVFTERNGATSAADVICAETGVSAFALDMGISGNSYFEVMYHNIDTVKEALG